MGQKKEKKVLGRGLGALIPKKTLQQGKKDKSNLEEDNGQKVIQIPIKEIQVNKQQPRVVFEQEKLEELSQSIKENGVIQPIIVQKNANTSKDEKYQIIAGERRFRAVKLLNLKDIPAIVIEVNDEKSFEIALIENIQRENLNAIEEGEAYQRLIRDYDLTQEEVAQKVGKSRSAIANTIRLLKLPFEIKNLLIDKKLYMGHIRCLLSVEDQDRQLSLAWQAVEENWSVRELEKACIKIHLVEKDESNSVDQELPKAENKNSKEEEPKISLLDDPNMKKFHERLQHEFGCKVGFTGQFHQGQISFYFHSSDDLHRLFEKLGVSDDEF